MAARQPQITRAFLSAKEANQRVDLNSLPAYRRWKHIAMTDVIRVVQVHDNVPGSGGGRLGGCQGGSMARFRCMGGRTLATSAVASRVPILFVLQDQVLLSAWACKDIRED